MNKFYTLLVAIIIPAGLSAQTGTISTIAGDHALGIGYSGDGSAATAAQLYFPYSVACDASGNRYIADYTNHVVRKVNPAGIISTFAGNYSLGYGYGGDGGPATAAQLSYPWGLAVDAAGNVYISDYDNYVIRKVNTSGIISTVAGSYSLGSGYSGDGGSATTAQFSRPEGIAVDPGGNIYVADIYNNVVRKVSASGTISTIAGNYSLGLGYTGDGAAATAAQLHYPTGVAVNTSGEVFISDNFNYVLRKVNTSGIISTIAGINALGPGFSGDGAAATAAQVASPDGMAIDAAGNLYFSDDLNDVVRMISTSGIINTVAGNYNIGYGFSGDGGPATAALLNHPNGLAFDASGNMYIADVQNNEIRKVSSTTLTPSITPDIFQVNIFPNPAWQILNICLPETIANAEINITDLVGVSYLSLRSGTPSNPIDISRIPCGNYMVTVTSGSHSFTRLITIIR
jgi:trimeric autotransporter adhesin